MDLILVMKERLRDQNSETRAILRMYLNLVVLGSLCIVGGLYVHPDRERAFPGDNWHPTTRGDQQSSAAGPVTVAYSPSSSSSLATSIILFIIGHCLLIGGYRCLAGLSRVFRVGAGWQGTPNRTGMTPMTPQNTFTPVRANSGAPGVNVGADDRWWVRYACEMASVAQVLIVAQGRAGFWWIVLSHCGYFALLAHLSHKTIAAGVPR